MILSQLLLYVLTVFEIKSKFPSSQMEFESGMSSNQISKLKWEQPHFSPLNTKREAVNVVHQAWSMDVF